MIYIYQTQTFDGPSTKCPDLGSSRWTHDCTRHFIVSRDRIMARKAAPGNANAFLLQSLAFACAACPRLYNILAERRKERPSVGSGASAVRVQGHHGKRANFFRGSGSNLRLQDPVKQRVPNSLDSKPPNPGQELQQLQRVSEGLEHAAEVGTDGYSFFHICLTRIRQDVT